MKPYSDPWFALQYETRPRTDLATGMHWWPNPLRDEDEVCPFGWLVVQPEDKQVTR